MKLKEGFITHVSNDEHIMVSAGTTAFNGVVRSNKSAGDIIELLKSETNKENIVTELLNKYDAPADLISKDVENVLLQLRKIGAIDE